MPNELTSLCNIATFLSKSSNNVYFFSVCAVRPPSGPSDRQRILSGYTRQLSPTSGKTYKFLSSLATSSEQNSTIKHSARRTQSAKPRLYRSEINKVSWKKESLEHEEQRPVSASAVNNIEPNVYGLNSGKLVCGSTDTSFSQKVQSTLHQMTTNQENTPVHPVKKHQGKYEV